MKGIDSMAEVHTQSNRYKVLDVRECIGDVNKPVVLICQEFGKVSRRRIEVWDRDKEAYETALELAPGDIINIIETYNRNGDGSHNIDEIEF
jgi:hypothetical protein